MKRQRGVWVAILCILVIGVFVTKMTSSFVASEPLSSLSSADPFSAPAEENTEWSSPETAVLAQNAAGAAEEAGPETESLTDSGKTGEAAAAQPEEEGTPRMRSAAAAALAQAPVQESGAASDTDGNTETESSEEAQSSGTSIQETVKSPLDPARSPDMPLTGQNGQESETAEEFRLRFDETAARIAKYRETSQESGPAAAYMAAEAEWNLWDKELNAVYSAIRSHMEEEEKDELRQAELDWIRSRDAAAEKAAGKSGGQTNRNAAYMEALAEATRDRCYALLDEYEEILNRSGS